MTIRSYTAIVAIILVGAAIEVGLTALVAYPAGTVASGLVIGLAVVMVVNRAHADRPGGGDRSPVS